MIQSLLGFLIIYGFIVSTAPYLFYKFTVYSIFITYLANVDIVSNILSINYPSFFKYYYNPNHTTFGEFISYSVISHIALMGIFIHGIKSCKTKKSDIVVLSTMVVMSIITYTLPTKGIPYITKRILERYPKVKKYELELTSLVSAFFILIEWIIIHTFIINSKHLKFNFTFKR